MMSNGIITALQNQCGSSSSAARYWKWDVGQFLHQPSGLNKYAVLILNRPITQVDDFLNNLWNNAAVRVTVDGGTKRWDKYINTLTEDNRNVMKIPDLVTGDFDSITEEVLQKYKAKGCKVVHTPDQNYTDFTKALMELKGHCLENNTEIDHVIAICQCSGRMDQILGNIQTLFLAKQQHLLEPNTKLYIMSDDAISWLLSPGDHTIIVPEDTRTHKRSWCSLVPIGEICQRVTSSGLKWNLDNQPLKFGEIVSTSNTFDGSEIVKIECSHTILWSMRVPSLGDP